MVQDKSTDRDIRPRLGLTRCFEIDSRTTASKGRHYNPREVSSLWSPVSKSVDDSRHKSRSPSFAMAPAIINKVVDVLRVKDGEDGRPVDRWTNPDILPVLPENRTFTRRSYFGFWYGLTPRQVSQRKQRADFTNQGSPPASRPHTGSWARRLLPTV